MSVLRVLSSAGDTPTMWDTARVEQGDQVAIAAVREAERIFAAQRALGGSAYRVQPGRPATKLDTFDPLAELIIVVPQVIGG